MADILSRILEPFFGWDIAGTYQNAHHFIDFVLYLFLFIYICRVALAKKFEGTIKNSLAIIIGISLAIGMSIFGRTYGFMIGDLAPMAGLIFLVTLGMIFFKLVRDLGGKAPGAGAFAFLLLFFSITAIVPGFYSWLIDKVDFLEPLLSLAVFFAVFIAVRDMIGLLTGGKKKEEEDEWPGITDKKDDDRRKAAEKKAKDAEEARKKAEDEARKAKEELEKRKAIKQAEDELDEAINDAKKEQPSLRKLNEKESKKIEYIEKILEVITEVVKRDDVLKDEYKKIIQENTDQVKDTIGKSIEKDKKMVARLINLIISFQVGVNNQQILEKLKNQIESIKI